MFGWFRKQKEPTGLAQQSTDPVLRAGVDAMVAFLRADSDADDDAIVQHLSANGFSERQAVKLVQFLPIAFTRFLYRAKGIRFAPNYVLLGPNGQPVAERPIADEPAYCEAWNHCVQSASDGADEEYFVRIAARSGGYRAIQELLQKGSDLAMVVTGPPFMMG